MLLAFADDEHLMGQQHTEWIGVAPFLEEDLAFCSIAQDELGHAAMLYELLAEDGGVDRLAFGRPPDDYRSCHLVEVPLPDWADALARHWLYDLAEELRWEALAGSSVDEVAAVVERAQREETYHRRHADALVRRMLHDPEAGGRVAASIDRLLPLADALWEPVAGEDEAVDDGVVTAASADAARDVAGACRRGDRPRRLGGARPPGSAGAHQPQRALRRAARPHQRGPRPRPDRPLVVIGVLGVRTPHVQHSDGAEHSDGTGSYQSGVAGSAASSETASSAATAASASSSSACCSSNPSWAPR